MTRNGFDGAWHFGAGVLVSPMAGHNWREYLERRERHLLFNAVLYTAAVVFEGYQTYRHWGAPRDARGAAAGSADERAGETQMVARLHADQAEGMPGGDR